jgi:flagellar protein FliL
MAEIPVLEAASPDKAKKAEKADKPDKADKAKKAGKDDKGAAAVPAGKKRLIIFAAIGVVVLAGGGVGGWMMFSGEKGAAEAPAEAKSKGKGKTASASKQKGKEKKEEEAAPKGPPIFVPLDPPFVVNFEAEEAVRFLQVTAQIMSRDPETVELLKTNDPIIRNDLLLLLGNQQYQVVSTREGKEALRAQALEAVRKVVTGAGGKSKNVEAVYFTSFVMQ